MIGHNCCEGLSTGKTGTREEGGIVFLAAAKRRAGKKMHIRWDPSSLDLCHNGVNEHSPILDGGATTMS